MKGHVLVVEDQHTHRMMMGAILMDLGLDVTSVDNGALAILKLEADSAAFDLIIMDWEMPEMDGLETVREIRLRQVKDGWHHIPVLAFTSNQGEGDMDKCLEAGMDDYLPKKAWLPKWQPLLLEKLSKWISSEDEIAAP